MKIEVKTVDLAYADRDARSRCGSERFPTEIAFDADTGDPLRAADGRLLAAMSRAYDLPPPERFDFAEARRRMAAGKRVRRASWGKSCWLYVDGQLCESLPEVDGGDPISAGYVTEEHFSATDWEEAPAPAYELGAIIADCAEEGWALIVHDDRRGLDVARRGHARSGYLTFDEPCWSPEEKATIPAAIRERASRALDILLERARESEGR